MKTLLLILLFCLFNIPAENLNSPRPYLRFTQKNEIADTTYNYSIRVIKKWEKFKPTRYELFGDKYIGYGYLLKPKDTFSIITEIQADSLLKTSLEECREFINGLVRKDLPENKKLVLSMLAYNCRWDNLRKSTLIKLVNSDANYFAIKRQYYGSVYAKEKSLSGTKYKLLPKLLNRRMDEFKIW